MGDQVGSNFLFGGLGSSGSAWAPVACAKGPSASARSARATDARGRFAFDDVPPERHRPAITVRRPPGDAADAREASLAAGDAPTRLRPAFVPAAPSAPPQRFVMSCGDGVFGLAYVLETRVEPSGLRVVSVPAAHHACEVNDLIDRIEGHAAASTAALFNALQRDATTVLRVRRSVAGRSEPDLLLLSSRYRVLERTTREWILEVGIERPDSVCDQRWHTRALSGGVLLGHPARR